MGTIRPPLPVKLFFGMISPEPALFSECGALLSGLYGEIDLDSDVMQWGTTDYYEQEMGSMLFRKFVFFREPIDPAVLSSIKRASNAIEDSFSVQSGSETKRRINIDPGYVTEAKVVLATTKDFSHRIYIGEGIYAEVTLRYGSQEALLYAAGTHLFRFSRRKVQSAVQ